MKLHVYRRKENKRLSLGGDNRMPDKPQCKLRDLGDIKARQPQNLRRPERCEWVRARDGLKITLLIFERKDILSRALQAREWYREDLVGKALKSSSVQRSDLFLTSKLHPRDLHQVTHAMRVDAVVGRLVIKRVLYQSTDRGIVRQQAVVHRLQIPILSWYFACFVQSFHQPGNEGSLSL